MCDYHDTEWGMPLHDDRALFEFLCLEGAQAGLSWRTVLVKRDNYRKVFHNFEIARVAAMNDRELEKLLLDPGIIRNRLKVTSTRDNAIAALEVIKEFGSLDAFLWSFVDGKPLVNRWREPARCARQYRTVRSHEQGAEEARLPFRRHHHLLFADAGNRHDQRSSGRLFPPQSVRRKWRRRELNPRATYHFGCRGEGY